MKKRIVLLSGIAPALAVAHPIKGAGDFYSGMLHPVLALEQVLPMIALGLLAGQQERRTAIRVLWLFPVALITGAVAGHGPKATSLSMAVELSLMVIIGILLAISRPLPRLLVSILAIVAGIVGGIPIASELTGDVEAYRFVVGAALTGLVVITWAIGLVRSLKRPWTQIAVRVAGSWVAAIGIMMLGLK
jgi:urease accessory protein